MQVQDVVNAVSNDIRQVLASSGTDALIFIPWVDQVHKDALHSSLYNPIIQSMQAIDVIQNQSVYGLTTPVRRIQLVYDRTFDRVLTPMDSMAYPTQKQDQQPVQQAPMPEAMLSATTSDQWPSFYRRVGESTLYLFPAPQKAVFNGIYEIHYEGLVPDLQNLTDVLLIPDDGIDLMVAGVNMKATQFLKLTSEAQMWQQIYEQKKHASST
jgi:hypothetical protein